MNFLNALRGKFGGQQGGAPADLGVDGMGNTIPFVAPTPMQAPQNDGAKLPSSWQHQAAAVANKLASQPQQNLGFPSAPPMQLPPLQQLQPSVHPGATPQPVQQMPAMQAPVPPQLQQRLQQRPQYPGLLGR